MNYIFFIFVTFSISNSIIPQIESTLKCCENGTYLIDRETCEYKKNISIPCEGSLYLLYNEWGFYSKYSISKDGKGEYLDAYNLGYIVRSQHFCVGQLKRRYFASNETVAVLCSTNKILYNELIELYIPKWTPETLFQLMIICSSSFSFLALAVTAFVYFSIPRLQNTQGICIFHLSLNLAILHASVAYILVTENNGLLPNFCITNLYLQAFIFLCCFMWSFLLAYNMWNDLRGSKDIDENKRIFYFRIFGYGIPCGLILMTNINVHILKLSADAKLEDQCYIHQNVLVVRYIAIPILFIIMTNTYFFIDVLQKLQNTQSPISRNNKNLKHQLVLNGKLFFTFGMLWTVLFTFIELYLRFNYAFIYYCICLFLFLVSSEGIFIFIITVILRARAKNGILKQWFIKNKLISSYWKTAEDSENSTEYNYEIDNK